ncbi:DNA-directed RNA polymerase specialized sigma24 family protein [Kitasatospora sp. GAS204A]|uniref:BACON domain-containing protein n=1 Tax=unclassified Kitasatospora TaxID=2633591 RepID=UPI002474DC97|nr:sigma-70 family RNA polymerase sigma factor [Kitasatospora sp. GAS204B]MDH6116782.1 DNA-directed RNA polymerase specialized sigma24 family protein [Kitasatospora sp. GAS204B]
MNPRLDPTAAFDQLLDGLYTYCLSVLCDRRAALAALDEARQLALASADRLADPGLYRAWLYSLARYACVRRLAAAGDAPADTTAGAGADASADASAEGAADAPASGGGDPARLGELAWPEAAGTTAEQREALELALRHRLTPLEVAAVLGIDAQAAQQLLADGRAEVERTRLALLVLGVGSCPELGRLGGAGADHWRSWVLGPALRRELVGHLVSCPTCRGTAERVGATLGAVGGGPAGLPLLAAPVQRAAPGGSPLTPEVGPIDVPSPPRAGRPARHARAARFDERGFPRHRAPGLLERHRPGGDLHERAVLVRQRALTTGVLAAVLSAPLAALWLSHRDGSATATTAAVSSVRVSDGTPDPSLGAPPSVSAAPAPTPGGGRPPVSALAAAVVRPAVPAAGAAATGAETLLPNVRGVAVPVPAAGAVALSDPGLHSVPVPSSSTGPVAQLTVEAGAYGSRTVLTLTNSGDVPLDWRAVPDCDWLRLSRDAGTLAPGQRITVTVTVDEQRAPSGHWTATIALPPSEAVVTLAGDSGGAPSPTSSPSASSPTSAPSASANPSGVASPSPSVTPTAGSSASSAPSNSESPSANPTSGPSATPSSSARPSNSPSAAPTPSPSPSGNAPSPIPSPAPTSATSHSSPSSPAR